MGTVEILDRIRNHVVNLELEATPKAVQEALDARVPPLKILTDGLSKGVEMVGEKFEAGEYFLSELIMAGEIMKAGVALLNPYLKREAVKSLGTIVLGTVKDDIHDIGKNIFGTLIQSAGFNVFDLGVDVAADRFISAVKEYDANILGMSALVTTTMTHMAEVVKAVEQAGLRTKVRIIAGGAPVTDDYAKKIGADAGVNDAIQGIEVCKRWMV